MNCQVVLELLDSGQAYPLQSWTFSRGHRILIGRAPENDVIVSDPFVSRSHAYIHFENDAWRLVAISSQQVVRDGQKHAEVVLQDGAIFRLGLNGCSLRFGQAQENGQSPEQTGSKTTLSYDPALMPIFRLDEEKMQREVSEITGSDYFQQLKQAASSLRKQRSAKGTP